ncbi:hypothetical protein D778_00177 [Xanthomarina gelatinilytica]|uniref:Transmembrane protein n=1 Tax=Xanthomarina gelatinilytica TaxID=1137281 RepID=M7MFH7_9FLAO|nr:hypothetical protein [Xanthomarina gelatinilytica]EMQ94992.1 hypothetical protein D778_00177 [Xanthomarina gelatinilytica]
MIPSKIELRDIINYLVPSTILIFVLMLLSQNFGLEPFKDFKISKAFEVGVILATLYIIGFLLRFSFGWFLRYKNEGIKNRFINFISLIFIGKPNKNDKRIIPENSNLEINTKWKDKLEIYSGIEQFYLKENYVSQYASDSNLYSLERANLSFSLAHRMTTVFFCSTIISFVSIILCLFQLGKANIYELVAMFFLMLILTRISYRLFQKFFDTWCIKNIRMFTAITELKEIRK